LVTLNLFSSDAGAQRAVIIDCALVSVVATPGDQRFVLYLTFYAQVEGAWVAVFEDRGRTRLTVPVLAAVALSAVVFTEDAIGSILFGVVGARGVAVIT
jgi:hypothetical protein